MRSISRVCDVSINTVTKLLEDAGEACAAFHDENVRGVKSERVQCDEIWSFCYAKEKNVKTAKAAPEGAGDVWTWTAIDAETKLIVSYFVGDRSGQSAMVLMDDLRSRLANRVQLTTDGHRAYLEAVEGAFGGDVDYAQLVKIYGETIEGQKRYSPAECVGIKKSRIEGGSRSGARFNVLRRAPEPHDAFVHAPLHAVDQHAHSKKFENHVHALALYFFFYNFARIHATLRVTPAMAANISNRVWSLEDLVAKMDAKNPSKKRGLYKAEPKKNISN